MELILICKMIWRRKWLIAVPFIVIFLSTAIATMLMPHTYKATAKLYVSPSESKETLFSELGLQMPRSVQSDAEMDNNIANILIDPVLDKVIARLQLRDKDANLLDSKDLRTTGFLKSSVSVEVEQYEDSDLLEIVAFSPDYVEAQMLADSVAEIYIESDLIKRRRDFGTAREFVKSQIEASRDNYLGFLKKIRDFKVENNSVDLETETKAAIDKVAGLLSEKEQTVNQISERLVTEAILKEQLNKESEESISSNALNNNSQISDLKQSLSEMEINLAFELFRNKAAHPSVIALQGKIDKTKETLSKEIKIYQRSAGQLQDLERDGAVAEEHLQNIEHLLKIHLEKLFSIPDMAAAKKQLDLEFTPIQYSYNSFLGLLGKLGVAEAMTVSDIRLVEKAVLPDIDSPDSPNKALNLIIGILLGCMTGLGLALVREYTDNTIKNGDDLVASNLVFLGAVPYLSKNEIDLAVGYDPKAAGSEIYRTIRNNLKFRGQGKLVSSLVVSGLTGKEGTTTVTANLAISFAREGKKVLLIEGDMRQPSRQKSFESVSAIGLSNILAGEIKATEGITGSSVEGLHVLYSGSLPDDPASLVESKAMKDLVDGLKQQFDIILIDAPPMLVTNDAVMFGQYVESTIFVVESCQTSFEDTERALDLVRLANIKVVGAIVNKSRAVDSQYLSAIRLDLSRKNSFWHSALAWVGAKLEK